MTPEERSTFLETPRSAVFSTVGGLGAVHSVLVWFTWDGESLVVLTERGSVKHRNVERTGRATVLVHADVAYVSVEGTVETRNVSPEERRELWTRYAGPEVAEEMVTEDTTARMVALVLHPEHWIAVSAG
ncbi:MAG: pyridoxamine 5'-phosphate oxidase family protein [Candidatus Dormibacteria bacterium]